MKQTRWGRRFGVISCCVGLGWAALSPACLVLDTPIFTPPAAVEGEGSCMCSLCWNQEFCFDSTRAEGQQVYPLPCVDERHKAVPATRVTDSIAPREGGFFCWKPSVDSVVDVTGKTCPTLEVDRAKVEHVEPCIDSPPCARPVAECGEQDAGPSCPEVPAKTRPTSCVDVPFWDANTPGANGANGAAAVVSSLAGICERHGEDPPSGEQPERYCYLNCVAASHCFLDTGSPSCIGCNGNWVEPHSARGTFPVELEPLSSSVTVSIKDSNGDFQPVGSLSTSGRIHINVPAACQGPDVTAECSATLTSMQLASIGTLTIGDQTVSNVRLINGGEFTSMFNTNNAAGTFSISSSAQFGLTGDVTGNVYRYADLSTSSPVLTVWNWQTRSMMIMATLESEDGQLSVQLQGVGAFDSLPPTSVATSNVTTLECTGFATLSAANSSDPDGASDIKSVTWTSDWNDGFVWQASGVTVDVKAPIGTHRFYAQVVDSAASAHTSFVDITVEDHSPPTLVVASELVYSACAPTTVALVPRTLSDTCDADPTTEITITAINGITTSIPYTSGYLFRFGETTVRYRAVDDAGNESIAYQTVFVERGPSCCPAGSTIVEGTSAGGSLTASSTQPSCLVGNSGNDHLYGDLHHDTLLGGPGNDTLEDSPYDLSAGSFCWGGLGNDSIQSQSPGSVLSGGPGDDTILYTGSAAVTIRGGAGQDNLTSTATHTTTFVLGAACEAVSGEVWTASGPVAIRSPISVSQILARGVVMQFQGSIHYVQTAPLADAECE